MLVLNKEVSDGSAWRGDELASDRYIWPLSDTDVAAIEEALTGMAEVPLATIQADGFPLGSFEQRLKELKHELDQGYGIAVLQAGQVFNGLDSESTQKLYAAIGRQLGRLVSANRNGDVISTIQKPVDAAPDRRYVGNPEGIEYHSDLTDYVALLGIRQADEGGSTPVVSSMEVYNTILRERPEFIELLYRSRAVDWKDEQPPGSPPWYPMPVYSYTDGVLSSRMTLSWMVDAAELYEDVPKLEPEVIEAFEFIQEVAGRPGMAVDHIVKPGEISIVNNWTTLHARTPHFDDPAKPEERRKLLRLWISAEPGTGRPVCADFNHWRIGIPSFHLDPKDDL